MSDFKQIEAYLDEKGRLTNLLNLLKRRYRITIVKNPVYNEECYFPIEGMVYMQVEKNNFNCDNSEFCIGYSEDGTKYLFAVRMSMSPSDFGELDILYIDKISSTVSRQRNEKSEGTCELRYLNKDNLILKHMQRYDTDGQIEFQEYYRIVSLVGLYFSPFLDCHTFVRTENIISKEEGLKIWETGFETLEELDKAPKRVLNETEK